MQPRIGTPFFWRNKRWEITGLRLEHAKLEVSADDGDLTVLPIDTFREYLSSGACLRVAVDRAGHEHPVSPTWMKDERESARLERQTREAILAAEAEAVLNGKTKKEARDKVVALCTEKEWDIPCERTLRYWRAASGGHESMLSPAWNLCGNRRQGPDELLLEAMQEVAEQALLSNDRFTITAAWEFVEALYDKKCRGDEHRPPQTRRRHSIKQFKKFLSKVAWITQMGARLDSRTRRALTRVAVHAHTADSLWELVEMDASWLDIYLRNAEGENIGRPILYAAIDVASGYPVGLFVTMQRPSVLPFVECLRFMYFPKPEGFDKKYGILKRIELYAKPIILNVDNGSEFIGQIAMAVVRVLLGDSARCKPYTPEEKPHIERFFGYVRAFVRTQPGSTLSAVVKEQREPGKGEELLEIEEFTGRLFRYIYDEYALEINESRSWKWRQAMAPIDLVKEMKKSQMEPFPVSRDEFEAAVFFKRKTRTLTSEGMSYDGWMYQSDELAHLYQRQDHGKYEFSYSDIDAATIHVHPRDGGEPVVATAKELAGLQVDRPTARMIRKEMAREGEILNERTFAARLARYEQVKADTKSVRERARFQRVKDALEQARNATLPTMPRPPGAQAKPKVPAVVAERAEPKPAMASPAPPAPPEPSSPTEAGSSNAANGKTFGRKRGAR